MLIMWELLKAIEIISLKVEIILRTLKIILREIWVAQIRVWKKVEKI